ncbi:MAG: WD40 repeat domain-containing protein [Planctomycetota bacterium]
MTQIPGSNDLLLGTYFGRVFRLNTDERTAALAFQGPDGKREFKRGIDGTKIAVSNDGQIAASTWTKGEIEIWKLEDGSHIRTLPGLSESSMFSGPQATCIHPSQKQLVITDFEGRLHVWDLTDSRSKKPAYSIQGPQLATGLQYSNDGKHLVQAGQEWNSQSVVVWRTKDYTQAADLSVHKRVPTIDGGASAQALDARYSPDGKWLATCGSDATVRLWRVPNNKDAVPAKYEPVATLSTLTLDGFFKAKNAVKNTGNAGLVKTWLNCVAFSKDSKRLAVCGNEGPVYTYDIATIVQQSQASSAKQLKTVQSEMGLQILNDRPIPIETLQLKPIKKPQ